MYQKQNPKIIQIIKINQIKKLKGTQSTFQACL